MVQISTLIIIFTSVLSTLVAAKSCTSGGIYCGKDLLKRGDYITKVNTNLKANNMPTDSIHQLASLWSCLEHGDISLIQYCVAGCIRGDKKDDYCLEDTAAKRSLVPLVLLVPLASPSMFRSASLG
ncbi:hypothetical protein LSUE1_G007843 [Lachnellula suecica]|uniref:Uncharacterized protein n=1 Tax=Lachnellula suecica TaxID=602035 RepID=A0A8T9C4A5_9HELO|nr:hypothetical protein LSUE1_G007843 [Lachnellula suecica]